MCSKAQSSCPTWDIFRKDTPKEHSLECIATAARWLLSWILTVIMVTISMISKFSCVSKPTASHHSQPCVLPGKQISTHWSKQTDAKGSSHADLSRAECAGEQVTRSKAESRFISPGRLQCTSLGACWAGIVSWKHLLQWRLWQLSLSAKKKHEECIEEQSPTVMKDKQTKPPTGVQERARIVLQRHLANTQRVPWSSRRTP